MSDTTPAPKNAFQFLMRNKSNIEGADVKATKKRKADLPPTEEPRKKPKVELSLIVKDETGHGNDNTESVFNKLAPKPASSFSPKKKAKKSAKMGGPAEYHNKICHLLKIRSGDETTWSAIFLEQETEREGHDTIDQLTVEKFLETTTTNEHEADLVDNPLHAQVPSMPNFCWYWKRAFNETTAATFGSEQNSPTRGTQKKTRRVHGTHVSQLTREEVERDIDEYRALKWESITGPVQARNCYGQNRHLEVRLTSNSDLNAQSVDLMDAALPSNTGWHCRLSPSILKSSLQKTIRRSRPDAAVRLALQLIKISFMEYIRRIIIIMFEDAILHPSLPVLTWLLMANIDNYHEEAQQDEEAGVLNFGSSSTSFKRPPSYYNLSLRTDNALAIPSELLSYVLQIAYDLAAVRFRDTCDVQVTVPSDMAERAASAAEDGDEQIEHTEAWPTPEHIAQLSPFTASLVQCILVRSSFGGMTGDMHMLRQYAKIWHARFKDEPTPLPGMVAADKNGSWLRWLTQIHCLKSPANCGRAFVDYRTVGPVTHEDCLLAGIDFHCSPMLQTLLEDAAAKRVIDEFMLEKFKSVSDTEAHLRRMVWWFRSSINNKVSIYPDLERVDVQNEHDMKTTLFHLFGSLSSKLDQISCHQFKRSVYKLRNATPKNNANTQGNKTKQ